MSDFGQKTRAATC